MIHIDHVTGEIVEPDHARAVALDPDSTLGPPVVLPLPLDHRRCCQSGSATLRDPDQRLDALRLTHRQHSLLDVGWQWAVIGLDGDRPVVYGLGHPDGDGAKAAATANPDWYKGGVARTIIPPAIAARVRAGERDCRALGIRVARTPRGTIYGADLAHMSVRDLAVTPLWFPDAIVGWPWRSPVTAAAVVANYQQGLAQQKQQALQDIPMFGWPWTWHWIAKCARVVAPDQQHTREALDRIADDADRRASGVDGEHPR
jgi:hypothetical protein